RAPCRNHDAGSARARQHAAAARQRRGRVDRLRAPNPDSGASAVAPACRPRTPGLPVSASVRAQPFLAADVGGTHARMALVVAGADAAPRVLAHASYRCAGYPDLASIAAAFMAGLDAP